MQVKTKHFSLLTPRELYQILKIRQEVFMLEQNIICADMDGVDYDSWFVMGIDDDNADGVVATCARVFRSLDSNNTACIGRVATIRESRNKGIGSEVMKIAVQVAREKLNVDKVEIHSQSYVVPFYEKLGFRVSSPEFLEEGVPHKKMEIIL